MNARVTHALVVGATILALAPWATRGRAAVELRSGTSPISVERLAVVTKTLASDGFEGRAPGTPGEARTPASPGSNRRAPTGRTRRPCRSCARRFPPMPR